MMRKRLAPLWVMTIFFSIVLMIIWRGNGEANFPMFSVEVSLGDRKEEIPCWMNSAGEAYVFLPGGVELEEARIKMNTSAGVYLDGNRLYSGMLCDMFQKDISYELKCSNKNEKQYTVQFVQSANVPTMFIETESGSMEYIHAKKGNEEAGEMRLYLADGTLAYAGDINDINGRGNNTWEAFEKKPYSINLKEAVDLLGMGAAAKWILLANADDPSHMRNKIVFNFADEIGLAYSPDADWVDLYLNGEYAGLYLLSERNEVHQARVDISKDDSALLSMERTDRIDEQQYPHIDTTRDEFALRVHYPQQITNDKLKQIQEIWDTIETAILQPNTDFCANQSATIDMESWVKKYLVEELFANIDGCMISQFFYLQKENGQWIMYAGPVWDYDHSVGLGSTWQFKTPVAFFANTKQRWEKMETPWFYCLYRNKDFYKMMITIYQNEIEDRVATLLNDEIYTYLNKVSNASRVNQIRWDVEKTCESATESIQSYLTERNDFLRKAWVENIQYKQVKAIDGYGTFCGYFAIEEGCCLTDLPILPDNEYQFFLGWYYEDTDEPFDPTRPIYEDTAVYAKWEDTPYKRLSQIKKLLPAGVIAIMFLVILAADVRRMRKGG